VITAVYLNIKSRAKEQNKFVEFKIQILYWPKLSFFRRLATANSRFSLELSKTAKYEWKMCFEAKNIIPCPGMYNNQSVELNSR
jgi:hypothetical protein